jgi:gliding motility-associated-like protein
MKIAVYHYMRLLAILVFNLITFTALSQNNLGCPWNTIAPQILCGSWSIQGDDQSICGDGIQLWLQNTQGSNSIIDSIARHALGSTDSYKVATKSYVWETSPSPSTPANGSVDDKFSELVNLPFPFCFYGNIYNNIVIGSNGRAIFRPSAASSYDDYQLTNFGPIPYNDTAFTNVIMSPYHDIDVSVGGSISYGVSGTAPCRKFIISWDNVPMFSCNALLSKQQIVLHEQSFAIDINIGNKPLCGAWESGQAFCGIQGNNTTQFAFPSGNYNTTTQWTASNVAFSFQPIGKKNLSFNPADTNIKIYWYDSATNNIIGVGDTLNYIPPNNMTIGVFIGDTNLLNNPNFFNGNPLNTCGKGISCGTSNLYKQVTVVEPIPNFAFNLVPSCTVLTVAFINQSQGASTYQWDFGDGNFSTQANPVHTYSGFGPYTVILSAFDNNCVKTTTQVINFVKVPIVSKFTPSLTQVCMGGNIIFTNQSTGFNLSHQWNMGDGTTYNNANVNHTFTGGGTYFVQLTSTDGYGCVDTDSTYIYVEPIIPFSFLTNVSATCVGTPVQVSSTAGLGLIGTSWNMGDGGTVNNSTSFNYAYNNPGNYTITCVSDYSLCPNQTTTGTIAVYQFPIVELGPPEIICDGAQSLIIIDSLNPGATYVWSTGATTNSITINSSGQYDVTVSYGTCLVTDTKIIYSDLNCIPIMNAFSPNDDELNDFFKPIFYTADAVSKYELRIYNRLGQELYHETNPNAKGWDGKFKGEKCASDTYFYQLIMSDRLGEIRKVNGDLFLIR